MYTITDSVYATLVSRFKTLEEAQKKATTIWPGCSFDGDFDLGAKEQYIYDTEENVVGYILYDN